MNIYSICIVLLEIVYYQNQANGHGIMSIPASRGIANKRAVQQRRPGADGCGNGNYPADVANMKCYDAGKPMDISVRIQANHRGDFIYGICNVQGDAKTTEQCFKDNPVPVDGTNGKYTIPTGGSKTFKHTITIPADTTCDSPDNHCVLRWFWDSQQDGTFYSCADIMVAADCTKVGAAGAPAGGATAPVVAPGASQQTTGTQTAVKPSKPAKPATQTPAKPAKPATPATANPAPGQQQVAQPAPVKQTAKPAAANPAPGQQQVAQPAPVKQTAKPAAANPSPSQQQVAQPAQPKQTAETAQQTAAAPVAAAAKCTPKK